MNYFLKRCQFSDFVLHESIQKQNRFWIPLKLATITLNLMAQENWVGDVYEAEVKDLWIIKEYVFYERIQAVKTGLRPYHWSKRTAWPLIYRQFHKTLPRSSAFVNWISVRFYEIDCIMIYMNFRFRQIGSVHKIQIC